MAKKVSFRYGQGVAGVNLIFAIRFVKKPGSGDTITETTFAPYDAEV
jgi:hypothetical protein